MLLNASRHSSRENIFLFAAGLIRELKKQTLTEANDILFNITHTHNMTMIIRSRGTSIKQY